MFPYKQQQKNQNKFIHPWIAEPLQNLFLSAPLQNLFLSTPLQNL